MYESILLLWLSYRLGKWSNFLGENTFTRDCPCVTSSLAPLVMYPFQRSKYNVCRETTSFKPFNPPKCYSEEKQKRWERIFVLTNFANANFRPGEISAKRNFASMGCEILPRRQRNLKFAGAWTNFGDELSSNVRENKRNRRISLYFCTSPYSKFVNSLCRGTEYIGLKIPT